MLKNASLGFTFIEILLSLMAIAILITMAMPCYRHLLSHIHVQSAAQQINNAITLTRRYAVEMQHVVKICPRGTLHHCGHDWRCGQLLVDHVTHQVMDVMPALSADVVVEWRSSLGKNDSLAFDPTGFTHGQVGRFYLSAGACHKQLVVNQSGRVSVAGRVDGM